MSTTYTRGELEEMQAGVFTPTVKTVTFDGTGNNGKVSTKSALTTALTGTNNDMVFTADTAGIAGDSITIEYSRTNKAPGFAAAECSTSGSAITVNLKTSAGVKATSTLTGSNAANATDGKVVVIGSTTYRLKDTPAQAYDVKIGANADATLGNLIKAINASGTPGTEYFAGTLVHPSVTAGALAAHAFVITATAIGTDSNSIATTTDETTYSWTSTVMAGGEDLNQVLSTAAEVKTAIEANTAAAALVDIANSGADDGSGVVTVMAATNLTGGSDGTVDLFTVENDGLIAILGDCTESLIGDTATIEIGLTGNTAGLVPQTTATTWDVTERLDKNGVIATTVKPDVTPFFPVRAGDVIQLKVGTASVTDGTATFQMYYKQFDSATSGTGVSANQVQGTAADNAAAVGNPVLTGAEYNATPPTYADGDVANSQADVNGNLKATLATAVAGEDISNDVLKVEQRYTNVRVTADTLVKTGVGQLHEIVVSQPASATPTAGVLTVYDNTAESGTVLFQHYFPAAAVAVPVTIPMNCGFTAGCYAGFDATLAGLAFNFEYR